VSSRLSVDECVTTGFPMGARRSYRTVPLDDIWGRPGADLYARLVEARELSEQMQWIARPFSACARNTESSSARLARRAARLIEEGEARVGFVAEKVGVTARHLRRAFTDAVGVSPKIYARSVRLQRTLRAATTTSDWGRIAVEAGYYDQAHLIGDFQALVGVTPGAFAGGRREADLRCTPGSARADSR